MLQIPHQRFLLIAPAELLQCPDETLLLVLCLGYPELFSVLHDIGQDGTTEEDHVLSTRGIFDSDFEVLLAPKDMVSTPGTQGFCANDSPVADLHLR